MSDKWKDVWETDPELAMDMAMYDSPETAIRAALAALMAQGKVGRTWDEEVGEWRYYKVVP